MPHLWFFLDVTDSLNLRFGRGFEVTLLCSCLRGSYKIRRNAVLVKLDGHLKASLMPVGEKWGKIGSTEVC